MAALWAIKFRYEAVMWQEYARLAFARLRTPTAHPGAANR
jgi:hypothetical protein